MSAGDYKTAVDNLLGLEKFGIKFGLEQIGRLLTALGNPERSSRFIHVAGTNGKGSTCAMLEAALRGVGFKTGFYSSPHLYSIRERLRVDGKGITEERFTALFDSVWPLVRSEFAAGWNPTFFEVTTAMAAKFFAEEQVDFVVWETGMGGRLDATNAVLPVVTAITGIGLEHQLYLGDTERLIALEKAGIVKPGVPLVLGHMSAAAREAILEVAESRGASITLAADLPLEFQPWGDGPAKGWEVAGLGHRFHVPLPGDAQRHNAKTAFATLRSLADRFGFDLAAALAHVQDARWRARFQILPDGKIFDGAHNPQGTEHLLASMRRYYPGRRFVVVYGCLDKKDPTPSLRSLAQIAERFVFVNVNTSRGNMGPAALATLAADCALGVPCSAAPSAREALAELRGQENVLLAGSLYMAEDVLPLYYTEDEIINLS